MASNSIRSGFKRSALTVALGLCFAGTIHAQSTTGTLFGSGTPGDTITVVSETGFSRTVAVDSSGRYTIANLPVGDYTVTMKKGDAVVATKHALLRVGAGTELAFATGAAGGSGNELGSITVTGSGAAIDVTQVDSRVVITSKELSQLPVGHSAESIALLAPGAVAGSTNIQSKDGRTISTVSFGGAGVTENAYYVNGYNSTDPLGGLGGAGLPYGSIAQQETYIGGYSAMYGRSDGGVISQVGKRGTNDWHFGGQVRYAPKSMQGKPKDEYFGHPTLAPAQGANQFTLTDDTLPGTIYRRGKGTEYSQTTYDAYIGGPLIPNKLFFFVSAEGARTTSISNPNYYNAPSRTTHFTTESPKFYGKLDWNINDNNILEFTNLRNRENVYSDLYSYNFATGNEGAFAQKGGSNKLSTNVLIGKYTSYLSDDMTLSVTYGKSVVNNPFIPGANFPNLPGILGSANQDPAITGGTRITNAQPTALASSNRAKIYTDGLRVDGSWRLGNHTLTGGIDNMHYDMRDQGRITYGAGYRWNYQKTNSPTLPLVPGLGVGAPNKNYYVTRNVFIEATGSKVDQTAYYLEDSWQVTNDFLLKMGLRNDRFVNKNNLGQTYVNEKNQWAPRIGFSWDMKGDSTSKLYGNVGRYYLALPPSVAIRGASASTNTAEYFTYTGINANGEPTGLTALGPGPVSPNLEYGVPVDPNTVAARGLKAQYQDEFILGWDKQLSSKWMFGVKGTVRMLRTAIDDYCDPDTINAYGTSQGINMANYDTQGCYIFNPGRDNTFYINSNNGSAPLLLKVSNAALGFKEGPKRKYVGLDLYLDHPFDGKWSGRIDYTWSRSSGNTEGQVKSDTGQGDTSKTQDWDYGAIMDNADGVLQNDRTHQLKLRGTYQFAPEWLLTGTASFLSGRPKNCFGFYGVGELDPAPSYGQVYHWCGGSPQSPGSAGRMPWTKLVNLGIQYRPNFAQKKLMFGLDVFNVLNSRTETNTDVTYNDDRYTVSNTYGMGTAFQTPRRVVFSITYDY